MDLFRFIDVHLVAQRLDFTSSFFGCWVGKTGMAQVEHLKIAWRLVTITATTVEDEEVGEVCLGPGRLPLCSGHPRDERAGSPQR